MQASGRTSSIHIPRRSRQQLFSGRKYQFCPQHARSESRHNSRERMQAHLLSSRQSRWSFRAYVFQDECFHTVKSIVASCCQFVPSRRPAFSEVVKRLQHAENLAYSAELDAEARRLKGSSEVVSQNAPSMHSYMLYKTESSFPLATRTESRKLRRRWRLHQYHVER